jgi:(2Fe-2S) ferredoxin
MTTPYYRIHAFICTNRRPDGHKLGSCAAEGSEHLRNYMKEKAKAMGLGDVRINGAGCLGRCAEGPAMVIYPEGIWYSFKTEADIDEILTTHIAQGGRVERLVMGDRETA